MLDVANIKLNWQTVVTYKNYCIFAGIDEKGVIVERPGKGVRHISGRQILDNHSVNLLSSIGIALTLPRIANVFWP